MGTVFRDFREYAAVDGARTHKSTAGSQPRADEALLARAWEALEQDGYAVVPSLVPPEIVCAVRDDVLPRLAPPFGRNNFEGFATQRLYNVLGKTLACNPLVEHPVVLGLLDRILEPNYLLSQLQVINILPGEKRQTLHYDDAFYPWPRPRRSLGAAAIWAIDEFTEENGATVVIPGSHRWPDRLPSAEDEKAARPIVMPAGSLLFFHGTLWHGGGENRSSDARLAVAAQYCAPFLRQQENFSLEIPIARAKELGEHIQRMVGYSIYAPFMGFVDGAHPKRLLV
jgi:hypothetical protein